MSISAPRLVRSGSPASTTSTSGQGIGIQAIDIEWVGIDLRDLADEVRRRPLVEAVPLLGYRQDTVDRSRWCREGLGSAAAGRVTFPSALLVLLRAFGAGGGTGCRFFLIPLH